MLGHGRGVCWTEPKGVAIHLCMGIAGMGVFGECGVDHRSRACLSARMMKSSPWAGKRLTSAWGAFVSAKSEFPFL